MNLRTREEIRDAAIGTGILCGMVVGLFALAQATVSAPQSACGAPGGVGTTGGGNAVVGALVEQCR